MHYHSQGRLRSLLASTLAGLVVLLSACCGGPGQPPCNDPHITVSTAASSLIISGSQFAGATPCAHLSITGLPSNTGASGSIALGDVTCSAGAFNNFVWSYSFFNCIPSSSISVSVIASDQSTLKAAVQPATLPWGVGCGLVNYTHCGDEGEIPCTTGCSAGPPDLHMDLSGGLVLCTKNCGHTQGYAPCTAGMDGCPAVGGGTSTLVAPQRACVTKQNGLNVFSCYDHSLIQNTGECLCMPNLQNSCAVNTSVPSSPRPVSGLCVSGSFSGC